MVRNLPLSIVVSLIPLFSQVRGAAVKDDTLYSVCTVFWLVDRENQDYHNFSAFAHSKAANSFLLHSVCLCASCHMHCVGRAEEDTCMGPVERSLNTVAAIQSESYPQFILVQYGEGRKFWDTWVPHIRLVATAAVLPADPHTAERREAFIAQTKRRNQL